MKRFLCLPLAIVFTSVLAQQQPSSPHLGYAFPAGGKQGTTVDVLLGGQLLLGARAVYVSGSGIDVTVGEYTRPLNQKEFQDVRDKLTEAAKKVRGGQGIRGALARNPNMELLRRIASDAGVTEKELNGFLAFARNRQDSKRQLNPQLAETIQMKIKIDPQAAPGLRELRVMTALGLSNPIRFFVGTLPEYQESESNDKEPNDLGGNLPVVVNGKILPGDVDRFAFKGKKGANLVLSMAARTITPYLADAVPGWFQGSLAIYDAKGSQLAFADHGAFDQDSTLDFRPPADGTYILEVRDSIYRGREDFIYRVSIGELPYVTSVYPLGGPVGGTTSVSLQGWNLPSNTLKMGGNASEPGVVSIAIGQGKNASNSAVFAQDSLPEVTYKKPVGKKASVAMAVKLPVMVNGRIEKPGDAHEFSFKGKAGDKFVAEVIARRLNSPLDSTIQLIDQAGKLIAANDDFDDKGAGLITNQSDSYLSVRLPSSGTYRLVLCEAQHKGGPAYSYRLRLSAPRPDFALRVVPSSLTGRAGMNSAITVYAVRKDGFAGDIQLGLKDAPKGFALNGAIIPGSADKVRFTMAIPGTPADAPIKLYMEGSAFIEGKEIRHPAVPAEDLMQAFAYRHLVPVSDWLVGIIGRANRGLGFAPIDKPVKLVVGAKTEVRLSGPGKYVADQVQVSLNDAPAGITVKNVTGVPGALVIEFMVDRNLAKAGLKGNLILDLFTERTPAATATGKQAPKRRVFVGTLPAIPFEVVGG